MCDILLTAQINSPKCNQMYTITHVEGSALRYTYQVHRQAALASAVEALVQAVAALPHTLVIAHS
jgi:hypothetical protein